MRLLFRSPTGPSGGPDVGDEIDPSDACDEARNAPTGRPWVLVNMIASIDGATAIAGRSGGLGSPGDKAVFRALRAVPDVVLVGAATARAEGYGPIRLDERARERRRARGQAPEPRLALVSGRMDLDPDAPMFRDAAEPPMVFTTGAGLTAAGDRFAGLAELVATDATSVDLTQAIEHLHGAGARVVLGEGGPHLNGQLVAAGLVDEWCQSLAPMVVAGDSARVAHGPRPTASLAMDLHRLLEEDGYLFGTWRRRS